ncbi:MAG: hypothetical protein F6K35_44115, partial [Okeania sp. SIO2H7]|nr:hypothetical protein [Okeania sp. SIO2H7]
MLDFFELNNAENNPYGFGDFILGETPNLNQINSSFSEEVNSLEIAASKNLPATNDKFDSLTGVGGDGSLSFIENVGQLDADADFLLRNSSQEIYFGEDKIAFNSFGETNGDLVLERVELDFINAKQNPQIKPLEKLPGVANFLQGQDSSQWHQNVPTYGGIVYDELYPGIDLVYSGKVGNLKSDFVVEAGVDASQIIMEYAGIEKMSINDSGELVLETNLGKLVEEKPVVYQVI